MKYIKKFENNKQEILNVNLLIYSENSASLQKVRELIKDGADVNCVDSTHRTPLIKSTIKLNYSIIKLLLENDADINIVDRYGETCLFYIVKTINYNYIKNKNKINNIVDLLMKNNVDMNIKNLFNKDIFEITDKANSIILQYIITNYPEKYKDYLLKKQADKFNL